MGRALQNLPDLFEEAARQLTACNACRYCEGFCPTWPVMERRREFDKNSIIFIANTCHDCRACYYACPYTPPHEVNLNIPKSTSEVRLRTYEEYSSPKFMREAFAKHRNFVLSAALLSLAIAMVATLAFGNFSRLFQPHLGSGSFYTIFPYFAIVSVGLLLLILCARKLRKWHEKIPPRHKRSISIISKLQCVLFGTADAIWHVGFKGGGAGCYHEEEEGSRRFLIFHALIFFGFAGTAVSTILAGIYQDILGIMPPYPVLSLPVGFGIVGGVLNSCRRGIISSLPTLSDTRPSHAKMRTLDFAFLSMLALVAITGFVFVILETPL